MKDSEEWIEIGDNCPFKLSWISEYISRHYVLCRANRVQPDYLLDIAEGDEVEENGDDDEDGVDEEEVDRLYTNDEIRCLDFIPKVYTPRRLLEPQQYAINGSATMESVYANFPNPPPLASIVGGEGEEFGRGYADKYIVSCVGFVDMLKKRHLNRNKIIN